MAKKNTSSKNTVSKNAPSKDTPPTKPKVIIRTYQDSDLEAVQNLYSHATTELIPEAIRSKLWAIPTWVVWFVVYTTVLILVPKMIVRTVGVQNEIILNIIKVFLSFLWAAVGFAILIVVSDKVDTTDRIEEGKLNDLADPELFYLNYQLVDGKKERKPQEEQVPSHFWVLTLDDEVCGMVGLTCNKENIYDQRKDYIVGWKCVLAHVFEMLQLSIPSFLLTRKKSDKRLFIRKQIPNTATVTRWIVHPGLLNHGFSTLLMNRVITWSSEHGIDRIYAETNECNMAAEQILEGRHGFMFMKRTNLGFFGQYKKLLVGNVPEWMSVYGEKSRAAFKKSS